MIAGRCTSGGCGRYASAAEAVAFEETADFAADAAVTADGVVMVVAVGLDAVAPVALATLAALDGAARRYVFYGDRSYGHHAGLHSEHVV